MPRAQLVAPATACAVQLGQHQQRNADQGSGSRWAVRPTWLAKLGDPGELAEPGRAAS